MRIESRLQRVLERPHPTAANREDVFEDESAPRHFSLAVPLNGFVPKPPTIEELQIVQRVFFLSGDEIPRAVVFCGVEEGDGVDAVCARTAEVLSSLVSETVCIMDANLRAPTLHLRYDLDEAIQHRCEDPPGSPMRGPNLWVLPARALKDARPGFSPEQVRARLAVLRENFGFLLMLAPPLSTAAEGFLLGQMADGVVLTVMAHSTQRAAAQKVRRNLELYNVRTLGAVLNERSRPAGRFGWRKLEAVS